MEDASIDSSCPVTSIASALKLLTSPRYIQTLCLSKDPAYSRCAIKAKQNDQQPPNKHLGMHTAMFSHFPWSQFLEFSRQPTPPTDIDL